MPKIQKFRVDIWFNELPNKIKLGSVRIYADTEDIALGLARAHTDYQVSGVDETIWQVKERQVVYA